MLRLLVVGCPLRETIAHGSSVRIAFGERLARERADAAMIHWPEHSAVQIEQSERGHNT